MFTHTATIGRNVGTEPMTGVAWLTFQLDIADDMWAAAHTTHGAEVTSIRTGLGEWEGSAEDSATITILSPEQMPQYRLLELKGKLAAKCREFKQDAIALSVNVQAELISAPAYKCHENHAVDCGV